jgi:hypothetical protein
VCVRCGGRAVRCDAMYMSLAVQPSLTVPSSSSSCCRRPAHRGGCGVSRRQFSKVNASSGFACKHSTRLHLRWDHHCAQAHAPPSTLPEPARVSRGQLVVHVWVSRHLRPCGCVSQRVSVSHHPTAHRALKQTHPPAPQPYPRKPRSQQPISAVAVYLSSPMCWGNAGDQRRLQRCVCQGAGGAGPHAPSSYSMGD